ncbi:MAG: fibronectin type III domain-containing protein, partial [Lachnospiraceae bacterium]|nr:fibronectin type III domain-containing protein [Lachnospiraceae bacterium]
MRSKTLKRITAIILAISMVPINDYYGITVSGSSMTAESTEKAIEGSTSNIPVRAYMSDKGEVSLKWDKISDEEQNVNTVYKIYREDTLLGTVSEEYYNDSDIEAGCEYTYFVQALDESGNIIAKSSDITFKVPQALNVSSNYTLTKDLEVFSLTQDSGCLDLNGHVLKVYRNYNGKSGSIKYNGGSIYNYGDYTAGIGLSVCMNDANDYMYVGGNFIWNSSYSQNITNGIIEVAGDFTASDRTFVPTGYNKVVLSGSEKQNLSINRNSSFNILELNNHSEDGIHCTSTINYKKLIRNKCNISIGIENGSYGYTLDKDTIVDGDYVLAADTLDLNGHTLTINGNLIQAGGNINVNGGTLNVLKDYRIQTPINNNGTYSYDRSPGILCMTNEADRVIVGGDFITSSTVSGVEYLTTGTMEVKGDFTVDSKYSQYNFIATDNHKILLNGTEKQTLSFGTCHQNGSSIANLDIENNSEEGVVIDGKPLVKGNVNDNGNKVNGYIVPAETISFTNNSFNGNIYIYSSVKMSGEYYIGGEIYVSSYLTVSGKITVGGNIEQGNSGYIVTENGLITVNGDYKATGVSTYSYGLSMTHQNDYVLIKGNFTDTSYVGSRELTAGTLEVQGDFTVKTFYGRDLHKVVLSGAGIQTVSMQPDSYFATLELRNYSDEGVKCERAVTKNTLIRNGCRLRYGDMEGEFGWTLTEDYVYEGDLVLIDETLDLNGHTLKVTGDLIQPAGIVNINGGNLIVDGDYRQQTRSGKEGQYTYVNSSGILKMTNPDDYVVINGDYVNHSSVSHQNYLSAGVMEVHGDFEADFSYSYYSFYATGTHRLILNGTTGQTLRWISRNVNAYSSRIANLELNNTCKDGITIEGKPFVTESVNDGQGEVSGYIIPGSNIKFSDNHFGGSLCLYDKLNISDDITIEGDIYNYSGRIVMNSGRLTIMGSYDMNSSSNNYGIEMSHSDDYIMVYGNFTFNPYYSSTLSAGTLEVKGDFNASRGFIGCREHRVILSGDKCQTVNMASSCSMAVLELKNTSADGIYAETIITKQELIRNGCNIRYKGIDGELGYTLTKDEEYKGDFVLVDDTLDLNGHTLTVTGDFIHTGGKVDVNGGSLVIDGDYRQQTRTGDKGSYTYSAGAGVLHMTDESDYVLIKGDYITGSYAGHQNHMTAGLLEIQGNMEVTNESYYNFYAQDSHTTKLSGNKEQTISFRLCNTQCSRINNLILDNTSDKGITFDQKIYVTGKVTDKSRNTSGYIAVSNSTSFENGIFSGSIHILENTDLNYGLNIGGNLNIGSILKISKELNISGDCTISNGGIELNCGRLVVGGNFSYSNDYANGIKMTHKEDYVLVKGNFTYLPRYNSELSGGILEVGGDFTASTGLYAVGGHKVILSGDNLQTVDINASCYFNTLELKNYSEQGVYSKTSFRKNELIRNGCKLQYGESEGIFGYTLSSDYICEGDFVLIDDILDLNGHTLTVKGDLVETSGEIVFNGGTLIVEGDYRLQTRNGSKGNYTYSAGQGKLTMTNPSDNMKVSGDFVYERSYDNNDSLSEGLIEIGGDFVQSGIYGYNGTNHLKFTGEHTQTITAYRELKTGEITNDNTKELVINAEVRVSDQAYDNRQNVNGTGYVSVSSISQIQGGNWSGSIKITGINTLDTDLNIGGVLTMDGQINLNGHHIKAGSVRLSDRLDIQGGSIECAGDFNVGNKGILVMQNSADNVMAGEDFTFISGYNHEGLLNNGILEIRGSFTQDSSRNFIASGNHTTMLSRKKTTSLRTYIQSVSFKSYAGETRFNRLILKKPLAEYQFQNDIDSIANEVIYDIEDSIPPTSVTSITETESTATTISIRYEGASDEGGIAGYEIYRNGIRVGATSNETFTDRGLLPSTTYTYKVYAFDSFRNMAVDSPEIKAVTKDDTEAPSIPQGLSILKRTGSSITLTWQPATDNVKTAGYKVYRGDELIADSVKKNTYKDSNAVYGKAYNYSVEAYDDSGNISGRSNKTESSCVMPEITEIYPADNSCIGSDMVNLSVKFKNTGNSTGNKIKIEYLNDDGKWEMISPTLIGQKTFNSSTLYAEYKWDIKSFTEDKEYKVKYTLFDEDDNKSFEEVTYRIDKSAPKLPKNITAEPDSGNITLKWEPSVSADCICYNVYRADKDSEEYSYIGKAEGRYANTYTDCDVAAGQEYRYVLTVSDVFGNISEYSENASATADEDNKAPNIVKITPDAGKIKGRTRIEIIAEDNKAVRNITLYYKKDGEKDWNELEEIKAESGKASYLWNTKSLADGIYIIQAVAEDESGNRSDGKYTRRYVVDNSGPGKVNVTDNTTISSAYVQIRWEDLEDEDLSYYQVEQLEDGIFKNIGKVSDMLGYTVTGLVPDTEYTFRVAAYDELGNRGTVSEEITVTTLKDDMPPSITAIYPVPSYYKDILHLQLTAKDNYSIDYGVFSYSTDKITYKEISKVYSERNGEEDTLNCDFNIEEMPEGSLYIRFEVYDKSGNKNSLTSLGEDVEAEYKIDRTAPSVPKNLEVASNIGNISLTWNACSEEDVLYYKVYRADMDTSVFKEICTDVTNAGYCDTDIKEGKSYIYKITAVDKAGNESGYSSETAVTATEDTEPPVIKSMSPHNGDTVGKNAEIKVLAIDNSIISSLVLEYRKADNKDEVWKKISSEKSEERSCLLTATWNTDGLCDGRYEFRAKAADGNGNESNIYSVEYNLDTKAPDVPEYKLIADYKKIVVSIDESDAEDFSKFIIYRREENTEYTKLAETADNKYIDNTVISGKMYYYKVAASDRYGNMSDGIEKSCIPYGEEYMLGNETGGFIPDEEDDGYLDKEPPVADAADNLMGIVGMEIALDGRRSTDNVKVVRYEWDMGNGDIVKGATATYIYSEPGTYTITLTVWDKAGNSDSKALTAHILEKDGNGMSYITVTGEGGIPIPYAYVYVRNSENGGINLQTDESGKATFVAEIGIYSAAAYADKYIPNEVQIKVKEYEITSAEISLKKDKLILGSMNVKRMNLQEIVDAGIDLSDPANINTFEFRFTVTLIQTPIPMEILYNGGAGKGSDKIYELSVGGGSSDTPVGGITSKLQVKQVEPGVPILATVTTTQSVSWLKEMYSVSLQVFNAADTQFTIKDAKAVLDFPSGVDIASGKKETYFNTIEGQQQAEASWVLRGNKPGEYTVSADFEGTLMPFDKKVMAHFESSDKFEVIGGTGMHITIMPEKSAYIGDTYYIQFAISNQSPYPFYNFETTIPPFEDAPSKTVVIDAKTGEKKEVTDNDTRIADPSKMTQSPVTSGGNTMIFDIFNPGDVYYGTFKCTFDGEGDSDKVYYEYFKSVVDILQGEDLNVTVDVRPIDGHISKNIVEVEEQPSYTGDPVDLSSGSFTDEKQILNVTGGTTISLDISYDSRITQSGELGTGWKHSYEQHLEEKGGTIRYYTTPYSYAYFVKKDALNGIIYGKTAGGTIVADQSEELSAGEYICLNSAMKDYVIQKKQDGTYTVKAPNGDSYLFDSEGRLSLLTDNTGKTVSITHNTCQKVITDGISGRSITLNYNESGLLTSAYNDIGKYEFAYTGKNLTSVKDAEGNTTTYTYDADGRLVTQTDAQGITYVSNEYDKKGRVTKQTNATGGTMHITYEDSDNGTKAEVTDENGNIKSLYADSRERVTKVINENGGTAVYTYDNAGNLLFERDAYKNAIYREYDARGNMVKYTDTGNLTTLMAYDGNSNIISLTNAEGRTATYTYNERNLKTSETDYGGKITTYEYNEDGLPVKETVEGLGSTTYTYDRGLKTSETDAMGNTTRYEYDNVGNIKKVTDALGNTTTFTYDRNGRKIKETDAAGGKRSYTFDCNGNMTSATDTKRNTTTYSYDGNGRLIKETYPDGTLTTYTYDGVGNRTSEKAPDGSTTTYSYDVSGNLIKEKYADGTEISYTYDLLNQRLTETDKTGNTISYEYYPNGNISREKYTDKSGKVLNEKLYTYNKAWKVITVLENGTASSYTYDVMGNVTSHSDALGNTEKYGYDQYGRLTSHTDAMGSTETYGYDKNGNCITKTNAMGVTAHMEYDALNRLASVYTDADGRTCRISYKYDALGRVIQTTDEEGNITKVEYDSEGNVTKMTDALGNVVQTCTYDSMGRMAKAEDALGSETAYSYDKAGRLTETIEYLNTESKRKYSYGYDAIGRTTGVTDPLNGNTSCTYDDSGNISSMTDPNGGTTTYGYDGAGRLLTEINAIGCKTEYTYNAKGLLEKVKDAEGRDTVYTYDAAGRVTSLKDELGTVKYTYDKNGNVLTVEDKGGTIERKYDALNRVTEYKDARGYVIKYKYDALGNLTEETYPDGSIVKYTYYKNGYLHTVTDADGKTTSYKYNGNGKVTEIKLPDGTVENDTYDRAGRLTGQTVKKGKEEISSYSYTYDAAGNMVSSTGTGTDGAGMLTGAEMTYDKQNRLVKYNGKEIKYDKCGNMTYGPVDGKMTELTYDCRNRLVSAGGVSYGYDAENNRTYAKTKEYTEEYVTDTVSSELSRVVMVIRSDRETRRLTYGNGLISEKNGDEVLYHHYNNIGSTMVLTDENGAVKTEYTYGTYGELLGGDETLSRYLYNGKYGVSTDENGLYYMRQRYYNTEIKRFINQDIVVGSIGNSQSLNRYSYVQGNPVTLTDPFGLSPSAKDIIMGAIHGLLDVVGCSPELIGMGANLINAALYAFVDHDYGMAALSLLAGVTFGAAKVVAMGGKFAKAAKTVETVGRFVSNVASFAICTKQAVDVGSEMWQKYYVEGKSLDGSSAMEFLTLGLNMAGMAMSGKGMVESGNKICKSIKESGVTRKISGKVKSGVKTFWYDNRGFVDFSAP